MDLDYKSLDWAQQLLLCKDLTERFGVLHEAQILQLKGWLRPWLILKIKPLLLIGKARPILLKRTSVLLGGGSIIF